MKTRTANFAAATHSGGSAPMVVNEFGYSDGAGVLDGNGQERFNVGATLQGRPEPDDRSLHRFLRRSGSVSVRTEKR